jgi:hypothetical protein
MRKYTKRVKRIGGKGKAEEVEKKTGPKPGP